MKIAILFRGESFRYGSQDSRNINDQKSVQSQLDACSTHINLIKKLKENGHSVDLFINTVRTDYTDMMMDIYKDHITKSILHTYHLPNQVESIKSTLNMILESSDVYDRILLLRIDMHLKDLFIETYDPTVDKIQFFSVCWWKDCKTFNNNPRISDIMYHFPRKYHQEMVKFKNGFYSHYFLDFIHLSYMIDYCFLTNCFYDSDTEKDFNPYYKLCCRKETTSWHSPGKVFPNDFA